MLNFVIVSQCGKGTHFSYGPWANRQREHLYKFFFPNTYEPMQVTKPPQPGERRQAQSFDIRLSTQNDATIDVLFTKNKAGTFILMLIECYIQTRRVKKLKL